MAFPDVPIALGVPAIPRDPNAVAAVVQLLVVDVLSALGLFAGPQWGIFREDGTAVVVADSVATFDFKQDWTVSTFPVEPNAFASYDKVQLPCDIRIQFSSGGSEAERRALINSVAAIAGTLELFTVVTPEKIYASMNVTHYDYRRAATQGVGLLVVDVWCTQVRVGQDAAFTNSQSPGGTTTPVFSDTKTPGGASPVSGGTVQASPLALSSSTVD